MSLIDILRQGVPRGFEDISDAKAMDFRDIVNKVTFNLEFGEDRSIGLSFSSSEEAMSAFVHAFVRNSGASIDSIKSSISTETRGRDVLAWSILKMYYSAFFAGHAILATQGNMLLWLEPDALTPLRRRAEALLPPILREKIAAGYYSARYSSSPPHIVLQKTDGQGGGAHEVFWKDFVGQLDSLLSKIPSAELEPDAANEITVFVANLVDILRMDRARAGTWLSATRNKVNYRHLLGVWTPVQARHDRDQFLRIMKQALRGNVREISVHDTDVVTNAISAAAAIISVNVALARDLGDRWFSAARCPLRDRVLSQLHV